MTDSSSLRLLVGCLGLVVGACADSGAESGSEDPVVPGGSEVASAGGSGAPGGASPGNGPGNGVPGGGSGAGTEPGSGPVQGGAGNPPSGGAPAGPGGSEPATAGAGGVPASGDGGASPAGGSSGGGAEPSGGNAGSGPVGEAGSGGLPAGGGAGSSPDTGNGGAFTGTCTESTPRSTESGTGPYEVVIETNSDPGIEEGTIFRPAELGGEEKFPIFVWGQGACSRNGLANETAMVEIASHGYFVVADGTPGGSGNRTMDRADLDGMGAPLIAYVDWAIAENGKPCSAYYQSLLPTKISSNGFSCGGLMAQGTVTDERFVTWGVTSSGMAGANQAFYDLVSTPVLFVEGGPAEVAYDGGLEGYERIADLGVPVLWFSKDLGHGGDLFQPDGGDFTRINLAWLNWWLKGDEGATGKGHLLGADCPYCSDPQWEVMSANLP